MRRRTILVLVVIAVVACLVAAAWVDLAIRTRAAREAFCGSSDLHAAIVRFMEQNAGKFPTKDELAESPFVAVHEDGCWVVRRPQVARPGLMVYEWRICDLAPFEVQWGAPMESLHLGADGRVVNANGNEVYLIKHPGWGDRGRRLTKSLYEVWLRCKPPAQPGE